MKLFGVSLHQALSLCIGVFSKRKSNLILVRTEIQRLKVKAETQSLWNHPVCLAKHSEWGPNITEFPITHLGNSSTSSCSSTKQNPVYRCGTPNSPAGINEFNCGTESIKVTACLTTGSVGGFSLKHKCCKAAKNRNSKTVWQVHELLPKEMIPSLEMKISLEQS